MIEPLIRIIEVACNPEKAFTVFVDMGSWWPVGRFATSVMRGQTVKALRVQARAGGEIVEVGSDDREHHWGKIETYEPYGHLSMDFHVPHPTEESPGFSSVEIRFTALGEDRTCVELVQGNWEALGAVAEMARAGYQHAWAAILEGAYKVKCGG